MTSYDHFIRLIVLIGLVLGGLVATLFASFLIMVLSGIDPLEILEMSKNGAVTLSAGLTRSLIFAQHSLIFIGPGLLFGFIFYRFNLWAGLDLSRAPGWGLTGLAIFFLIAAYPLVNLSFDINESIPLPEWATSFESQAADTLKLIMTMDTPWILMINLLIIAILPGIGEELIFRGIFQKQLGLLLKNPIASIWISAFLFSAIHLQFEGVLPRMVLGASLGYLYYWTGNLWVPMIAHAFNNGIQVILIYSTGIDITSLDQRSSEQMQWWMYPVSAVALFVLYMAILKYRQEGEPT